MNVDVETQIELDKITLRSSRVKHDHFGTKNPCYRHGMEGTPTYRIWCGIKSRCNNPNVKIYKYYGGRGIKVCKRWEKFLNFYIDMGARPKGLQLDRIDNDKGYSSENCRWVTPRENNPAIHGDIKDYMPGKTFGKWFILRRINHKEGLRYYICKCSCGTESIVAGSSLRSGQSKQCKQCKHIAHRRKRVKNTV